MPNPDHVQLVKIGADELQRWRSQKNPNDILDLSSADLRGCNLTGCNLELADLTGANLNGCTINGTKFGRAKLHKATFHDVVAKSAPNFVSAEMQEAEFNNARLFSPVFENAILTKAIFEGANCADANCLNAKMPCIILSNADFTRANFRQADLSGANLSGTRLMRANLQDTFLSGANITKANFFEATCIRGDWDSLKGLASALNLETIVVHESPKYLESSKRSWIDRRCSWEQLRTFGRLPLFGASYTVLIFIPIWIFITTWYNHQIDELRKWPGPHGQVSGQGSIAGRQMDVHVEGKAETQGPNGQWISQHLHKLPIPPLYSLLFISTILLAVASTTYVIFCPSRIREFTKDGWCDELKNPLLHYWPFTWRQRPLRVFCGACYVVGGLGDSVVLAAKLYNAGVYILTYTPSQF
jgi:hypothetical protein